VIEEMGWIVEMDGLAARHLIAVAPSTGMEVWSNAGMPSGKNKIILLEGIADVKNQISTLIKF